MNLVKELSNKLISISDFNKGLAGRIFEDVKQNGLKIVLKNNSPECVLISVQEYLALIDKLEDVNDLLEANKRLSNDSLDLVSQEDFENELSLSLEDVEPISDSELE